jgi:TrpR-related protein YerC/YecD
MRNVSNIGDAKLVIDQVDVLVEIVASIKNKADAKNFLENFLTESELLYLAQRMNIQRMLAKDFSYSQIREKIKAQNATITKSKEILDKANEQYLDILLKYKYKKKYIEETKLPRVKYKGF